MGNYLTEINIADIQLISELDYRPVNDGHVKALVAANEPDKWPPIIVAHINGHYGLIAGRHRTLAAIDLKRETMRAEVREYHVLAEVYTDMWEDNSKHGIPPTTKERKEYAVTLHKLQPTLTLREIGRRAGIPHQTVQRALDEAKSASTGNEAVDAYRAANQNYAKRLKTVCLQFFQNEKKPADILFFKVKMGKGTASPQDTDYRALLLASEFKDVADAPAMLKSLAKSLEAAATRIEQEPRRQAQA